MSATTMNRRRYPGNDPTRRITGWIVVVLLHIVILWALVSGTARKGFEILKKPLEAAVIQEVIIPPPPPPPPPPPKKIVKEPEPQAPKIEAPPPFVPPPEVTPPVSAAPAIAAVTTPPPAPHVIAPPPPPVAPPRPAGPARAEMAVACPTQVKPEMPRKALQEGTEGVVRAQALIRDGVVKEVTILSGPRIFHAPVRNAMLQYKCVSESGDVLASQEFVFKMDN
jgi:protein TonB